MTQPRDALSHAGSLAGNLPGLLLEAEKVAHSFMRGVHGRRRVGTGEAFWQFRPYQPGDARRDIDWRQTAKRDQAFVRQMEWEAAQTVWMHRDASKSMDFKSAQGLFSKKEYAEILLLALGIVLLDGGEQVSLLGTDLAPQTGTSSIQRIFETLPAQTHLVESGRFVAARSHALLISDFYFPVAQLASFCESLAMRHVGGMLVQVFDPAEQSLPYAGRIRFQDVEDMSAEPLLVPQVEAIREEYGRRFAAHRKSLAGMAAGFGWKFEKFGTDTPLEEAIVRLYDDLSVKK
ncbi:MAG: DUF58 domain-containing protein [Pseudomonadota bacterium]